MIPFPLSNFLTASFLSHIIFFADYRPSFASSTSNNNSPHYSQSQPQHHHSTNLDSPSSPPCSSMRLSRSLNLLPLSREAAASSFRDEVNRGAWDFPTTLKRDYR